MEHKTLHTLALIVLGIVVLVGGWYVYANTIGRPMLEGETEHDFGIVWIEGFETKVSHTFELINNTKEIIFVQDIVSSCKCTIPELDDRRVMPGTTFRLPTELTVKKSGMTKPVVSMMLGDGRVQKLYVQAIGRRKLPLTYIGRYIELLYNLPKNMGIRCEIYSDSLDEPDPLMVKPADGVQANFKRWKLVEAFNAEWQNPAIWEAELILTRTDPDDLPLEATIDVSLDGTAWLSVPINRPDLIDVFEYDMVPGVTDDDE